MTYSRREFLRTTSTAGVTCGLFADDLLAAPAKGAAGGSKRFPPSKELRRYARYLWELVDAINAYRKENDLPAVPISSKLTAVARAHVFDLAKHSPHKACGGNLHAWSKKGKWKGGCYKSDDKTTYPIMWNKPKEIAAYEALGFEVAARATRNGKPHIDATAALKLWQNSPPHRDVLLSRGIWSQKPWKALGAVHHDGFACAWFGRVADS